MAVGYLYERPWDSVCGIHPREEMSLRVTECANGWYAVAYTGDGSKPGSLVAGAGGFPTAEKAFAYLLDNTNDRLK